MDLLSILQSAAFQASEMEAKRPQTASKKWHLNYKWLINPKVQCPWCQEWLPTGRVWVVDEAEEKVRKLWTLAGERLNVELCHPHVGTNGTVCMGTARTVVDALTASISNDAYPGAKPQEWFPRELGHRCETMGGPLGDEEEEDDDDSFYCYGCEERVHNDDGYYSEYTNEQYCSDCYWEVHSSCNRCYGEYHQNESPNLLDTPDGPHCQDCFNQRYFECEGCEKVFRLSDYAGNDRCQECYDEKWERCLECDVESEIADHELQDDMCKNCWQQNFETCMNCDATVELGNLLEGLCSDCQEDEEEEESDGESN